MPGPGIEPEDHRNSIEFVRAAFDEIRQLSGDTDEPGVADASAGPSTVSFYCAGWYRPARGGHERGTALFAEGDGPRPLVITCAGADSGRRAEAAEHAEVMVAGDERVDLGFALAALGERGHRVVLNEGGPTLLGLLADGCYLDELCLTLAPMMGGDPLPVAVTPPGGRMTRFRRCHMAADADGTLFLRYEVNHDG
ncbi:MAG: dihydrofolate reductase family protein [Acidimicrobiales bacterium]